MNDFNFVCVCDCVHMFARVELAELCCSSTHRPCSTEKENVYRVSTQEKNFHDRSKVCVSRTKFLTETRQKNELLWKTSP